LGVVDAVGGFADNGVAGLDQIVSFTDGDATNHVLTFKGGILTNYSFS